MARALNLGAYLKGEEGVSRIMEQKEFVARGQVWQGFKGAVFRVEEVQLKDEELMAIDDLDDTKHEVWKRRKERLTGRSQQKTTEYDQRRAQLRAVKNEIRAAIKADKELGIDPDPSDLADVKKINERMKRLVVLSESEDVIIPDSMRVAIAADEDLSEKLVTEAPDFTPKFSPTEYACPDCGEVPRSNHKNPKRWLTGHRMGKHKQKSA